MTTMKEIREKTDKELESLIEKERETLRSERFKDKMSRKASVIHTAKKQIAQALTELSARTGNPEVK